MDRVEGRREADFNAAVEAQRLGTVFAHDAKQYKRWSRKRPAKSKPSLTGAALEAAVMRIASIFPDNVTRATV